jgi:hypothetical protein
MYTLQPELQAASLTERSHHVHYTACGTGSITKHIINKQLKIIFHTMLNSVAQIQGPLLQLLKSGSKY